MITVTARDGATQIHVEEKFELEGWKILNPAGGVVGGLVLGAGLSQIVPSPEAVVAVMGLLGGAFGAYISVKWTIFGEARRRMPELQWLADRLAEIAGRPHRVPPGSGGAGTEEADGAEV